MTPYGTDISETTKRLWREVAVLRYYDAVVLERLKPRLVFDWFPRSGREDMRRAV